MRRKVYHGSSAYLDGEELQASDTQAGGIGSGVYVTVERAVAEMYAAPSGYVYQLELRLDEDEIFYLDGETISIVEGADMHAINMYDRTPPFHFMLRDQVYTVGGDWVQRHIETHIFQEGLDKLELPHTVRTGLLRLFRDELLCPDLYREEIMDLDEGPQCDIDIWFARLEAHIRYCEKEAQRRVGTLIDLDELGAEVQAAGYKAVHLHGVREHDEMLVFNPNDLGPAWLAL